LRDLHLVRSAVRSPTADEACLATFQAELDYIYRSLRHLGTPTSEVDDLAQEVFLALRQCWPRYDATRPPRPFLFGIAFRIAAAHQRKRRREVPFGIVEPDETGPAPDQTLHAKQARALVVAALERLPLARRAVVVMHEIDDVPVSEVASVLGIPLFTAYSRLRKGRRELELALRRLLNRKPGT